MSTATARHWRGIGARPGIDGLRALAVIAVVLYHAEVAWLPAGFLGVDVFFAISGYLICSLLVAEWETRQAIDLAGFWRRRARRLLPAMAAMTAAVVLAAMTIAPDAADRLRVDAIAGLLGLGNVWQLVSRQSYFEAWGRPPLLRHLWSLGVEAQFYAVFPFLLAAGLRRGGRRPTARLGWVAAGVAAASAVLMAALFDPTHDPSRVYYGTDTRMMGLWAGVAMALFVPPGRLSARITGRARLALDATGVAALLGVLVVMMRLDEFSPGLYRGGFALVAVLSATAVAIAAHPGSRLGSVLSGRSLRWIGTRSYAIYLWHWPVFMLTRPGPDVGFGGFGLFVLRLVITGVLAEASWRFVESPARRLRVHVVLQPRAALAGGLVAMLVIAGLTVVAANQPPPTTAVSTLASLATPSASASIAGPAVTEAVHGPPVPSGPMVVAAPSTAPPPPVASTHRPAAARPAALPAPKPTSPPPPAPTGPPLPPPGSVLAVGESVMLAAANALSAAGEGRVHVDAAVARQNAAVLDRLEEYRASGELATLAGVVVHMGTNGPIREADFERLVQLTEGVPVVVVVNVRVPKRWEAQSNTAITDGIGRHPAVRLADWHAASAPKGVVGNDGVHPTPSGAKTYARIVLDQLQPPAPAEPPPPTTTTTEPPPPPPSTTTTAPPEPPPSTEPPPPAPPP